MSKPFPIAEYNGIKITTEHLNDLEYRLRDDATFARQRWVGCKKIGDTEGMTIASQMADDCDEAAWLLHHIVKVVFTQGIPA